MQRSKKRFAHSRTPFTIPQFALDIVLYTLSSYIVITIKIIIIFLCLSLHWIGCRWFHLILYMDVLLQISYALSLSLSLFLPRSLGTIYSSHTFTQSLHTIYRHLVTFDHFRFIWDLSNWGEVYYIPVLNLMKCDLILSFCFPSFEVWCTLKFWNFCFVLRIKWIVWHIAYGKWLECIGNHIKSIDRRKEMKKALILNQE